MNSPSPGPTPTTAIPRPVKANGVVLRRLRSLADRYGLSEVDVAILDGLLIDNDQAARQGHIYSTVLGGLLDARGNIVNNKHERADQEPHGRERRFLPLGVIASMGGMSEFTAMLSDYRVGWRVGYLLFSVGMVLLGLGLWRVIGAWVDRRMGNGGGPPGAAPAGASVSRQAHDGVMARTSDPDETVGAVGANL